MNIFQKASQPLIYIAIVSMLLQPVAQAKSQSDMVSHVGLKTTANIQSKGLAGLKDLNAQALLANKGKKSKQVKIEKSAEEKLSQLSQDIYWQLKDWSGDNKTKAFKQTDKKKITLWLKQINTLEAEVNKNLNTLTQWIIDKKLSDVIMQRQQSAINKINTEVAGLKKQLISLNQATSKSATKQKLKQSFDFFKGKQLKRKHQVFDGLSSVALTPDRIKPATTTKEFSKYKFTTQTKAAKKNADFSNPIYLGTSDEVVINDFIRTKVTELNNDPVKIYYWVRNNIEWLPSHGAIQASDITLGSGRGNAFDQSSLLIAMLRAANVPSRYAYGTIEIDIDKFTNWVGLTNSEAALTFVQYGGVPLAPIIEGGVITKVQMEHIWVEAAIDFNPSRGAKNITPDSWVSLDASFKQYEVLTGLDPVAISGLDMNQVAQDFINSGTTSETEGWVQGFDASILKNAEFQMQTAVKQHVRSNFINPTIGDVIGGRRTIVKQYPALPASTESKILFKASDFTEMQEIMRPKYRIAFDKDILGGIQNPLELNFARINNHKLTLSFKPATVNDEQVLAALIPENGVPSNSIPSHLISVIPTLELDGETVKQGSPIYLGYDLILYYQVQFTTGQSMNKEYAIPAGSYINLMFGAGSISINKLDQLESQLTATKIKLDSHDVNMVSTISRENLFGDSYFSGSLSYIKQLEVFNKTVGEKMSTKYNLAPVFGSLGFETNVNYLFGLPISIENGNISLNIYTTRQSMNNNNSFEEIKKFNIMSGMITSSLEHNVPEQLYLKDAGEKAVSSISAIQKAAADGQKIYEITQININILENISFHPDTIQDITNAINSGYTVITHTNNITISGWTGAGYIIINPFSGDGSYRISGGSNGGSAPLSILNIFVGIGLLFLLIHMIPYFIAIGIVLTTTAGGLMVGQVLSGLLLIRGLFNSFDQIIEECGTFMAFALAPIVLIKEMWVSGRNFIEDLAIFFGLKIIESTVEETSWCP